MATSSPPPSNSEKKGGESSGGEGVYECHICFEQATNAVVSMCGHLFCWPCIHRWMESRPNNPTCPVCKSVIDKSKLIPLYGRGSTDKTDPRETVPPRPQGQREEPQPAEQGFGFEGINVSFGIGAFPFTMLGGPMFNAFGGANNPMAAGGRAAAGARGNPRPQEEQRVAKIFMMIAFLFLILIIFS